MRQLWVAGEEPGDDESGHLLRPSGGRGDLANHHLGHCLCIRIFQKAYKCQSMWDRDLNSGMKAAPTTTNAKDFSSVLYFLHLAIQCSMEFQAQASWAQLQNLNYLDLPAVWVKR